MGLDTAKYLTAEGARVMVTGRTPANLEAAAAELGESAVVVASDAASLTDIDALAARVRESFGRLDALVLNAGSARPVPFEVVSPQEYDDTFAVNARGPFFTVQRLADLIAPGGAVVLITSVGDVQGDPNFAPYNAAKAALRSEARSMARALLPRRIRVNAVSPGPIETTLISRAGLPVEVEQEVRVGLRESNPTGRFGTGDEIARAVAFLAFDATFTTGAELPVDGGLTQV